jgi:CRP/FNR family transcriptional regulator, cyclic AMP receptor protein
MPTLNEMIAQSKWADVLTPEERSVVEAQTIARSVAKGNYVCRKGEPVEHWIGVVDGLVKIATVSSQGKLATFSGVPTGGWFGEGSLLKNQPRFYDAIALRRSEIAYLPRPVFQWLLTNNNQFTRFLLVQLNERLAQAMALIEHQRLLGADGRVAQCLAGLFNPILYPGIGATLEISQEEIGLLVGLSRQRVNQALQLLHEKQLLRIERLGVTILDLAQLRRFEA